MDGNEGQLGQQGQDKIEVGTVEDGDDEQGRESPQTQRDEQAQSDDSKPSPGRQAVLRSRRDENLRMGHPPYAGVKIRTLGELHWVFADHDWSGVRAAYKQRPDLTGANFYSVNLTGARL